MNLIFQFWLFKQQDIIGMKLNKVLPNFNDEQMKQLTNTHKSGFTKFYLFISLD